MMRQAVECSKPGTWRAFGTESELASGLSLGIPQRNVVTSTIRRVILGALARTADHAGSDSLGHSAVLFEPCSIPPFTLRWRGRFSKENLQLMQLWSA